jgi:hypothetical protein
MLKKSQAVLRPLQLLQPLQLPATTKVYANEIYKNIIFPDLCFCGIFGACPKQRRPKAPAGYINAAVRPA